MGTQYSPCLRHSLNSCVQWQGRACESAGQSNESRCSSCRVAVGKTNLRAFAIRSLLKSQCQVLAQFCRNEAERPPCHSLTQTLTQKEGSILLHCIPGPSRLCALFPLRDDPRFAGHTKWTQSGGQTVADLIYPTRPWGFVNQAPRRIGKIYGFVRNVQLCAEKKVVKEAGRNRSLVTELIPHQPCMPWKMKLNRKQEFQQKIHSRVVRTSQR